MVELRQRIVLGRANTLSKKKNNSVKGSSKCPIRGCSSEFSSPASSKQQSKPRFSSRLQNKARSTPTNIAMEKREAAAIKSVRDNRSSNKGLVSRATPPVVADHLKRKRLSSAGHETDDSRGSRKRRYDTVETSPRGEKGSSVSTNSKSGNCWRSLSVKLLKAKHGRSLRISTGGGAFMGNSCAHLSVTERSILKERIVVLWKAFDDWVCSRTSSLVLPKSDDRLCGTDPGALTVKPGLAVKGRRSSGQRNSTAVAVTPAKLALISNSAEFVSVDSVEELETNLRRIACGASFKAAERNFLVKSFFPTRLPKNVQKKSNGKRRKIHEAETDLSVADQANEVQEAAETYEEKNHALGVLRRLTWYCEYCACFHLLTSNMIMCPFSKRHGFRVLDVPADGDCFYYCVQNCLSTDPTLAADGRQIVSVKEMREWVAEACCADQFNFYQIQAIACPNDRHLDFIRPKGEIDSPVSSPSIGDAVADCKSNDIPHPKVARYCDAHSSQFGVAEPITAPKSPPRQHIDAAHIGNTSQSKFPLISTLLSHLPLVASMSQYMNRPSLSQPSPISTKEETSTLTREPTGTKDIAVNSLSRKRGRPRKVPEPMRNMDMAISPPAARVMQGITEPNTAENPSRARTRRSEISKGEESSMVSSSERIILPKRSSRRNKGGLEAPPKVTTLQGLREFIRKEGSVYGATESMWADNFAFMIVGNRLKLTILLIDMERRKGCLPYRFLHKYEMQPGDRDEDCRFIVLKRTGPAGHFQYVQKLPFGFAKRISHPLHSPSDPQIMSPGAASISSAASPSSFSDFDTPGRCRSGGDALSFSSSSCALSCFSREQLPDVIVSLWEIP